MVLLRHYYDTVNPSYCFVLAPHCLVYGTVVVKMADDNVSGQKYRLPVYFSEEAYAGLDELSQRFNISKSKLVNIALLQYIDKNSGWKEEVSKFLGVDPGAYSKRVKSDGPV